MTIPLRRHQHLISLFRVLFFEGSEPNARKINKRSPAQMTDPAALSYSGSNLQKSFVSISAFIFANRYRSLGQIDNLQCLRSTANGRAFPERLQRANLKLTHRQALLDYFVRPATTERAFFARATIWLLIMLVRCFRRSSKCGFAAIRLSGLSLAR